MSVLRQAPTGPDLLGQHCRACRHGCYGAQPLSTIITRVTRKSGSVFSVEMAATAARAELVKITVALRTVSDLKGVFRIRHASADRLSPVNEHNEYESSSVAPLPHTAEHQPDAAASERTRRMSTLLE